MPRCWIGLGGNQGDAPAAFGETARRLAQRPDVGCVELSPLFRTTPMGSQAGNTYWNAVIGCDTELPALALLDELQTWEIGFGRVRTERWGPRPLDLDLLFYGDAAITEPRLTVPHPGAWYRRFVLDPLCCLAPDLMHPVWRLTVRQLRDRLTAAPPILHLWCEAQRRAATLPVGLRRRCPTLIVEGSDGKHAASQGLLVAVGAHSPEAWQAAPHLRFDDDAHVEQSIVDACAAAFNTSAHAEAQG